MSDTNFEVIKLKDDLKSGDDVVVPKGALIALSGGALTYRNILYNTPQNAEYVKNYFKCSTPNYECILGQFGFSEVQGGKCFECETLNSQDGYLYLEANLYFFKVCPAYGSSLNKDWKLSLKELKQSISSGTTVRLFDENDDLFNSANTIYMNTMDDVNKFLNEKKEHSRHELSEFIIKFNKKMNTIEVASLSS